MKYLSLLFLASSISITAFSQVPEDALKFSWTNPYGTARDRKSTRLNSSHSVISYAVFCLKKNTHHVDVPPRQLDARHRAHLVPLDFRRQRRRSPRPRTLHRLLPALRDRAGARTHHDRPAL